MGKSARSFRKMSGKNFCRGKYKEDWFAGGNGQVKNTYILVDVKIFDYLNIIIIF